MQCCKLFKSKGLQRALLHLKCAPTRFLPGCIYQLPSSKYDKVENVRFICLRYPANTSHLPIVGAILNQGAQRWHNHKRALAPSWCLLGRSLGLTSHMTLTLCGLMQTHHLY